MNVTSAAAARVLLDMWQGIAQPCERASVDTARRAGARSFAGRPDAREASCGQHTSSGFSLVETMVALIVVTMLTALVAANIPVAFRTFEAVQKCSNAQVALVSTTAALRGELSMATEIEPGDGTGGVVLSYVRADGDPAQLTRTEDGWFSVSNLATLEETPLVPAAMTSKLGYELSGSIRYDSDLQSFEISNLKVKAKEDGDSAPSLASITDEESGTYSFRALRAQGTEG